MIRPAGSSSGSRRLGLALVAVTVGLAGAAPFVSPNDPRVQHADRAYAPPMTIRVWDGEGLRRPFIYRQVLEHRLERRYRDDRMAAIPLLWFTGGRLVSVPESHGPLLLLGGDALGRDVLSRLLHGARLSLGVAVLGVFGAMLIGAAVGGLAGTAGSRVESGLMWGADFLLALPGAYLVLVLRGVLPPVLATSEIFFLMASLFAVAAWPHVARGVRAVVAAERARDYAEASRASGAGLWRLAWTLLPAARGFLAVEVVLLLPALLVAEATISYLGLGFPDAAASWGTLLQDAAHVSVLGQAPWLLAPAAAIFIIAFSAQLLAGRRAFDTTDLAR